MVEEKKSEGAPKKVEEAPKKSSLLESTVESYLGCKKDPVKALGSVAYFDGLRKETYLATFERAGKEPDPENEHGMLAQAFGQMKQEMGYFVGEEKYKGKFDDMEREEKISMYTSLGTKLINDTINPSGAGGAGGYRRRR